MPKDYHQKAPLKLISKLGNLMNNSSVPLTITLIKRLMFYALKHRRHQRKLRFSFTRRETIIPYSYLYARCLNFENKLNEKHGNLAPFSQLHQITPKGIEVSYVGISFTHWRLHKPVLLHSLFDVVFRTFIFYRLTSSLCILIHNFR